MKRTHRVFAALLALALLVSLCACASAPDEPSTSAPQQELGTEIPSASSQEEPPAALPEDTTELKVPLQMVEPGADVFLSGEEWSYSSQGDEDVCRQWLYDLRAEDITALYGEKSPLDHYWTGEMSMEDSRWVVDLLRSVAPDLAPLESGNPYTGGGWTIALYTEDEAVGFGFNGGWFTFLYQGTVWIFDAENAPVQESCNDIEGILSSYGSKGRGPTAETPATDDVPTERYFGEDVQAIYAVDRENYVMAEVKDGYAESKAIWEELENRASSNGEPSGYGYLIITDEGKEYVYLTNDETALNKYCQAALSNSLLHPSWLIHMTPERIEKVVMGTEPITDRDELLAVAKFLKEEVTVGPQTTIDDGYNNVDTVASAFCWKIIFDSGVEYTLIGYAGEDYLSLHSSDLNKFISYDLGKGVDWKFIEFEGRDWP